MDLRDLVKQALENALENGFDFSAPDELGRPWSDEAIAEDMLEFDAALANYSVEELVPFIRELR